MTHLTNSDKVASLLAGVPRYHAYPSAMNLEGGEGRYVLLSDVLAALSAAPVGVPGWLSNCVVCGRVVDTREKDEGGEAKVKELQAQIAGLEERVTEVTSDRAFIIGANAGWEAAVEQDEASPAAAAMLARAEAAETALAAEREKVAKLRYAAAVVAYQVDDTGEFTEAAMKGLNEALRATARAAITEVSK